MAGWPSGLRRQFKALVFGRGFESHFSHETFIPRVNFFHRARTHTHTCVFVKFFSTSTFNISVFLFHRSAPLGGMTIAELNNDGTLKLKDGSKATVKRRTTTSPKKVFDDYLHTKFHLINFFLQDGNQSHFFAFFSYVSM